MSVALETKNVARRHGPKKCVCQAAKSNEEKVRLGCQTRAGAVPTK